jgi:hypothetical protein
MLWSPHSTASTRSYQKDSKILSNVNDQLRSKEPDIVPSYRMGCIASMKVENVSTCHWSESDAKVLGAGAARSMHTPK